MMINNKKRFAGIRYNSGFSLIEMMLAMLIGIIIIGGIMATYVNTRDAQRVSEDQIQMVSDARFAIDTIAYDLRHAGIFGSTNLPSTIKCHKGDPECDNSLATDTAINDCGAQWYVNLTVPIFGGENMNPYATCPIASYLAGTDVLVLRYADSNPIAIANLVDDVVYVRSNYKGGELFVGSGTTIPTVPAEANVPTNNHLLISRAYYVSAFTDKAGDGYPSLRRVDLVKGPEIQDQLILPGVEQLQIQYGIDTNKDKTVDQYVNADQVPNWNKVYAARVWVLVRSKRADKEVNTDQTFNIAGETVPYAYSGNTGIRRLLVSSVVSLRNMTRVDEAKAAGS